MKIFLLGMLVMYLGTSIISLLVGSFTEICEDTFLEYLFMFPFLIIAWIIKPIKNFIEFPKVCIFCLIRGINPWHFNYSQVVKLSEENQQKFIKAHPKKYQKKVKKIGNHFRGYLLLTILHWQAESLKTLSAISLVAFFYVV